MDSNQPVLEYSVIIPVLNDAAALDQCLKRLNRDLDDLTEIIVVDGGSLDDTRERVQARYPAVQLIEASPGRGHQLNCGAARARGQILLFLHADCLLPADWQNNVADTLNRRRTSIAAFKLRFGASEFPYRLLEACVDLRSIVFHLPYGDQGYAVYRTTFDELGGFHEQGLMEDVDFVRRGRKLGRVRIMSSDIVSSARNYRQDGFARRCRINLSSLTHYILGTPADELEHRYRGRKNCVLVFCKKPEPGKVKTRLAEGMGKAAAAAFYATMVQKTIRALVRRSRPFQVITCFSPAVDYSFFLDWLGPSTAYLPQVEGDLGARLTGAVRTAEAIGFTDLVLIGTDCPDLKPMHIETALILLQSVDLVIGPANDGGYYLIAFHAGCPDLFADIDWSTDAVLHQTLAKAADAGLSVRMLDLLRDVDTMADLKQVRADR